MRKLGAIAMRAGVQLPPPSAVLPTAKSAMTRLKTLSGAAFDAAFLKLQQKGHQTAIAAYKQELSTTSDPALKSYAKASIPVLDEHLLLATEDATRLRAGTSGMTGSKSSTGGAGTSTTRSSMPGAATGTSAGSTTTGGAMMSPMPASTRSMSSGSPGATTTSPMPMPTTSGSTIVVPSATTSPRPPRS